MQLFMWQRNIVRVAHFVQDCFQVLGALDDAPDDASTSSSSARCNPFITYQYGRIAHFVMDCFDLNTRSDDTPSNQPNVAGTDAILPWLLPELDFKHP